MAASLTIEAHRKRFQVKTTPMMPLSAAVADVLAQLKLTGEVAPEQCRLSLKGKQLDISTPVRFANIGRNDKLELETGREPVLGLQTVPQAAATPLQAPVAAATAQDVAAAAASPSTTAPAPQAQQQQQQQQQQVSGQLNSSPAAAAGPPSEPSSTPPAAATASAVVADTHPSVAVFGRRVHVFTRAMEEQADGGASAVGGGEEDDSFFEFSEVDLRRAMASQATQRAREQGGHLMTAAMRAKEERRRAEAYGSVPIRLYLPDGEHCLQTALPATEPLSSLLALARAALAPRAAPGAYLFTTPPRTVLKDLSVSIHAAKMVPAAKVHVGLDASKAPAGDSAAAGPGLIRPEVLALVEAPPQRAAIMHAGKVVLQSVAEAGASGSGGAAAGGVRGAAARPGATGGKGVPKWLKLSGK